MASRANECTRANRRAFLRAASVLLLLTALAWPPPAALGLEDKIKDLIKANGIIELEVVEAKVPDLDPLPLQKDSDAFVRVYLNDSKDVLCETQVVQDENKPKVSALNRAAIGQLTGGGRNRQRARLQSAESSPAKRREREEEKLRSQSERCAGHSPQSGLVRVAGARPRTLT